VLLDPAWLRFSKRKMPRMRRASGPVRAPALQTGRHVTPRRRPPNRRFAKKIATLLKSKALRSQAWHPQNPASNHPYPYVADYRKVILPGV
jgi:hypothetical protein